MVVVCIVSCYGYGLKSWNLVFWNAFLRMCFNLSKTLESVNVDSSHVLYYVLCIMAIWLLLLNFIKLFMWKFESVYLIFCKWEFLSRTLCMCAYASNWTHYCLIEPFFSSSCIQTCSSFFRGLIFFFPLIRFILIYRVPWCAACFVWPVAV